MKMSVCKPCYQHLDIERDWKLKTWNCLTFWPLTGWGESPDSQSGRKCCYPFSWVEIESELNDWEECHEQLSGTDVLLGKKVNAGHLILSSDCFLIPDG